MIIVLFDEIPYGTANPVETPYATVAKRIVMYAMNQHVDVVSENVKIVSSECALDVTGSVHHVVLFSALIACRSVAIASSLCVDPAKVAVSIVGAFSASSAMLGVEHAMRLSVRLAPELVLVA